MIIINILVILKIDDGSPDVGHRADNDMIMYVWWGKNLVHRNATGCRSTAVDNDNYSFVKCSKKNTFHAGSVFEACGNSMKTKFSHCIYQKFICVITSFFSDILISSTLIRF